MKKPRDLQAELAKRKFKIPNRLFYFIYYVVGRTKLLGGQYNPHLKVIDKLPKKGAAFVIWNHQSRRDHTFLTTACWPRRLNIVCEYNSFFRKHLAWPFKCVSVLPKRVFANDLNGIKAIRSIIKKGGVVALSPEGTSSIFGDNQPVAPGSGRFMQAFNVPVYIMDLKGSYLTNNKICSDDRIGEVYGEFRLLWTAEEMQKMTGEELDNKMNELFHHDDYEWNKKMHIKYESHGTVCTNLQDMIYKCPRCGTEFEMEAKDNWIKCNHCGNKLYMDDYYDFHPDPEDPKTVMIDMPSHYVHQERLAVIDEIRKDPNYSFSVHVKLGMLPHDHLVDKTVTTEIVGEGMYTIDHKGVHFRGTRNGEEFNFDFDYHRIWTYPMTVDLTIFSLYIGEEYYDFYPDYRCVGKVLLLTEEMHRLHVNAWKNFPWFDWMYEGKPLGIDVKKD